MDKSQHPCKKSYLFILAFYMIFIMTSPKDSSFPLMLLFLLVVIFYLNFVARVVLAPLLPVIERELNLSHGQAGSLFFFIAAGYGIGLLSSGFVSAFLNHRRTITLSIMMVGVAMLAVSRATSTTGIHGALMLAGISAGFYLPSGIAVLTESIRKEHWGKAMAVHELAPNLGFITSPLLSEAFLRFFSWRGGLALLGVVSILMGVFFLFFGRGGKQKGESPSFKSIHQIAQNSSFWIMTVLFIVSIGSSLGLYTMMPLFLVNEIGMDRGWANTLIGLSRVFGIVVLFISGMITDRVGPKNAMTLFLATTGVFTFLFGFLRGALLTPILLFFQAASTACLFPVGFTVMALIFPSHLRSIGVSLVIFIGFIIGGGMIPTSIGYCAESFSFSAGFSLLGIFFLALLPLFVRIGNRLEVSGEKEKGH
jgi:NNP family nitrate/nitrite transporter-like MFS transporter